MAQSGAISLSVVVVTFDSEDVVATGLPALVEQLGPNDELVVVDNGSSDGTVARVRELARDAVVVELGRNVGFAAGANAGAGAAHGDLLLFLNPDAKPAPGFVRAIRAPLADGRGWDAWMGLVTANRGRLVNTNGGVVHFTGIAWAGEAGAPVPGSLTGPREVAFASGACLAVPRPTWERLGGFPEHYFMYQEDVDLSLRLRLLGGRIGVEPSAVVDHEYEFAKGSAKWRRLERNRWATILRCYPGPLLALVAPALLVTEAAVLVVAASGGWLLQKLGASADVVRALPRLLRERGAVQAGRAISATAFAQSLSCELESEYLGRAARSRILRGGLRAYWRVALTALGAYDGRPSG